MGTSTSIKHDLWLRAFINNVDLISHGLLLTPASSMHKLSLRSYSNLDWTSDPDEKRSTSGSCVFLGPNLVAWSSVKQSLVARSSTEIEYHALVHTTSKVLWMESLLQELSIPHLPQTLLCDNLSYVMLSHNPILHARIKHVELDIHFVREKLLLINIESNMFQLKLKL